MGNKPARKMGRQPYNQMVEDAISALKERPGSNQTDIIQYLEAKYETKISPRNKKSLETVMRSVIKSQTRRGGRQPIRGNGRRQGGFKAKGGPRRKFARSLPRGLPSGRSRIMSRSLGPSLRKKTPKPLMTTLKPSKKGLVMSGSKSGGHHRQQLLRRATTGTTMRASKILLRRTSSVGSMAVSLPRRRGGRN